MKATGTADIGETLKRLAAGVALGEAETTAAFDAIMTGKATPVQMAAFLTALTVRGPSVTEIASGARALRTHMLPMKAPEGTIDVVGTGGDNHGTLNVSTATAFVVAGCGVKVAKHGNRAASSRSGAADVLEALGVKLDLSTKAEEACLAKAGICFLFAPAHHPALKHVGPVRRELGFRTVFNLLGPLANPARVKRQLLGVYSAEWVEPIAETLRALGNETAWVVHGSDGTDEITLSGPTRVAALDNGSMRSFEITPEDAGLERAPLDAIKGGTPAQNAAALRALLKGKKGAYRDIVLFNAAAALIVAGKAFDLKRATARAAAVIDEGRAQAALDALIATSQEIRP